MDTVDSVGAYWSFYSIWNSLNVLLMTQSDAPNEGREEKIATQIARKIAAIPENKPEHAADHKLRAIEEIIDNTIKMVERHTGKELRDQLSKEREIKRELLDWYMKQLVKEREMRNELVWAVEQLLNPKPSLANNLPKIESLIAKASELDKK